MGKEMLTIEVDAELMKQLRSAGIEPKAHVERLMARAGAQNEPAEQKAARAKVWREENRVEINWYNQFVEANGFWSDGLRQF